MALNETPQKRQYTQYKRHVNDSHERVNASTVNSLQRDVNVTQLDSNEIKDKAFEERVYTIFNNDLYTNAMFIDYFKDGQFINLTESKNIAIEENMNRLVLIDKNKRGEMISKHLYSAYGPDIELNDFFLIINADTPVGASIKCFLEMNTGERWNIEPNQIKLPLHLTKDIQNGFTVIIQMMPNAMGEYPILNGYAVLYWDAQVEKNYGLTNPDLMRFP